MLRPIPAKILKHDVVVSVCSIVDRYQDPTFVTTDVARCVVQPSNETRKTKDNTEVVLRGILFADARLTTPFDWLANKNTSEANGHAMTVDFKGERFTVQAVETLYDDEGNLHHWEVGLV